MTTYRTAGGFDAALNGNIIAACSAFRDGTRAEQTPFVQSMLSGLTSSGLVVAANIPGTRTLRYALTADGQELAAKAAGQWSVVGATDAAIAAMAVSL